MRISRSRVEYVEASRLQELHTCCCLLLLLLLSVCLSVFLSAPPPPGPRAQVLGKSHVIKGLDKCDFTPIYDHLMAEREKKKAMSKEVREGVGVGRRV